MRLHVQQNGNRELRILRYRRIRKGTQNMQSSQGLTNIPGLLADITITQGSIHKIIINNLSKVVVLLKWNWCEQTLPLQERECLIVEIKKWKAQFWDQNYFLKKLWLHDQHVQLHKLDVNKGHKIMLLWINYNCYIFAP